MSKLTNLYNLRKKHNLTMKELGKKLNVSESTISNYEKGFRQPDFNTLNHIANFFNVSVDYILGRSELLGDKKKHGVKIPVLGSIPAGVPLEAIEEIIDYEEITEELAKTGTYFGLKVKGNSMSPRILNGDTVIIKQQDDADTNDVCVVMVNGFDATLKQIKKDDNGMWLIPYNLDDIFKKTFYNKKQIEELPVRILGKVIELRGKF